MGFYILMLLIVIFSTTHSFAHHESGELRNEEFTILGKKVHEGQVKIQTNNSLLLKLMTYNILAQTQLEAHPFLYKDHDVEALKWENRWPLIYNKIKNEDPQILCLQEVDPMHISSNFAKLFELGYNWVFKKNSGTHEDGVAVFYKSEIFEDEDHSQIELNQELEPLKADKVGVVVRLRVKHAPHQAIVVATTHLVYNPRLSDTRLAQIQLMLAEIDRLAYNRTSATYYPVVLTGDFNLQPYSVVYRFLMEGHLKYEGLSRLTLEPSQDNSSLSRELLPCSLGVTDKSQHIDVIEGRARAEDVSVTRLFHSEYNINPRRESSDCLKDVIFGSGTASHGFSFQSAYPHKQSENKIEASTNHNNHWITVDYIFYSKCKAKDDSQKEPLELLSWERLPTQDELASQIRYLPNSAQGSDHLPLTATFLLHLN